MPDGLLTATDFGPFYRAVHGHDPFPWQESLAAGVLAEGAWPDLIDVPTGLGKTSLIDVAVFVAAATAHLQGASRLGRRRCFFVVDRRIVVDEAYDHACHLAKSLADAERSGDNGIEGRVAVALRGYLPQFAGGDLLPVTKMRGGTTWAAAWMDRPDRPGIVLGTVDQVGSRLLFRGYGVTDRRRPIDAALVGTDALLLVDEAHLSTALLTTVSAAQQRDQLGLPLPGLSVVRLSATGAPSARTFTLDVDAHRGDREAWQRLNAGKLLTTREAATKDCASVLSDVVLQHMVALSAAAGPAGHAPTAVVVCNTVDRARAVHAFLDKQLSAKGSPLEADCELLIGRSRAIDRPTLQQRIIDRFGTGRGAATKAAVLVATQTVEVGVNLDADILVTESTSWDALVQRLGRLNRLGRFAERFPDSGPAPAVVVHDGQDEGPVYGAARDATWRALRLLNEQPLGEGIDVSPLACRELTQTTFGSPEFSRQPGLVPVLLRPTLDAWAQTGPVPLNDPPIEPFLHGFDSGAAGVQVVWRDGLLSVDPLDDPFEDGGAELPAAQIERLLALWPVRTAEIAEIPFMAVRQWMSGQAPDPISDVESSSDLVGRVRSAGEAFRALAWRPVSRGRSGQSQPDAPSAWQWIEASGVRPGDQIVVPSEQGGLDRFGWAPADRSPVRDASETATFLPGRSRKEAMLRLDRGLPARLGLNGALRDPAKLLIDAALNEDVETSAADRAHDLAAGLGQVLPAEAPTASGWSDEAWQRLRSWLAAGRLRLVEVVDHTFDDRNDLGEPPVWGHLLVGAIYASTPERDDEESGASSVSAGPVTLAEHHDAVRRRAGGIAISLGLSEGLRDVVADAAGWHDLGKVDRRFQTMLHGGDSCEAALASEPLAKSGLDPADRLAWRRAARLSKLPAGARHEAWSAALVEEHLRQSGMAYAGDVDLLVHLVASHHGYARPLARLVVDETPCDVEAVVDGEKVAVRSDRTVSLHHPARFARLNERYGRWGLALLESIVRCADMTVSGEGS